MTGNALNRMLWHVTLAVLVALVLVFARCAMAQDDANADTRILLRALAAEAWGSPRDYQPILAVLARRAERVGSTPAAVAQRYVTALRTGRVERRWVLALDVDCAEPEHWPARLAWGAHKPTCERIVREVRAFENGLRSTCKASHWGGPKLASDMARAKTMPRVDCGDTANAFYGEPVAGAVSAKEASGQ